MKGKPDGEMGENDSPETTQFFQRRASDKLDRSEQFYRKILLSPPYRRSRDGQVISEKTLTLEWARLAATPDRPERPPVLVTSWLLFTSQLFSPLSFLSSYPSLLTPRPSPYLFFLFRVLLSKAVGLLDFRIIPSASSRFSINVGTTLM